jgi:precorrin-2 dehydrogenase/sirohydrochlorin ferrochelatase
MMSASPYYPAVLNVRGRLCLVVGGGALAARKVKALAAAGARVTVVAPRVAPGWRRPAGVALKRRAFRPGDLRPRPWLVFAATDDEAVNARVSRLCAQRGIWVNVVDRPALCSFIVPAVARRGELSVAVSTGGASPALAGYVARKIRTFLGPEYGRLAYALKKARPQLLSLPLPRRRALLRRFFAPTHPGSQDPARRLARLLGKVIN